MPHQAPHTSVGRADLPASLRGYLNDLLHQSGLAGRTAAEVGGELGDHLFELYREGLAEGLGETEAARRATERFGDADFIGREIGSAKRRWRFHPVVRLWPGAAAAALMLAFLWWAQPAEPRRAERSIETRPVVAVAIPVESAPAIATTLRPNSEIPNPQSAMLAKAWFDGAAGTLAGAWNSTVDRLAETPAADDTHTLAAGGPSAERSRGRAIVVLQFYIWWSHRQGVNPR